MAKTYKSMQGKIVDIDLLRQRNELTPAVGNARVNARGDELGRGGAIVRTREEILKDYYNSNVGMPSERPLKKQTSEQKLPQDVHQEQDDVIEEWIEDDDGNFEKKARSRSRNK